MADEDLEQNGTGVEPPPEAVGFKQVDTGGFTNATLWRYGIEDTERLPFAGPGMWRQIGPAPLLIGNDQIFEGIGFDAGVVVDIAIDPSGGDNLTLYIATANGGIWKTTNGGASWQPLTDFLPSSAVGAVGMDPGDPNIVYAGIGNLFESSGVPKSTGLFKSIDGGATWAHMDGGIARSDDGGATYVSLNEGLATALLEDIDIGRGANNNLVTFGGMQDMGTGGHAACSRRRGARQRHIHGYAHG